MRFDTNARSLIKSLELRNSNFKWRFIVNFCPRVSDLKSLE